MASTRSKIAKNPNPKTPKPSMPKNTSSPPTQQSPNPNQTESGAGLEGTKRRRLNKGKGRLQEEVPNKPTDTVSEETTRVTLRDFSPQETSLGIDKLRLTKDERRLVNRVAQYEIHGGRYYPKAWCDKYRALGFFSDFLNFQEWETVAEFSGPVYPIEVIQFFSSVSLDNGVLHAVINGRSVSISVTDFCTLFLVPDDGIKINPSTSWDELTDMAKLEVKQYFDVGATVSSCVLAGSVSPKLKFLLNFLWNTVIPRRGGRDKIACYEMLVVKHWLEGNRVNLPSLVFNRISQTAFSVTEDKFYSTLDLPYGMWLSRLFESKGVVNMQNYGVAVKDEMCDTFLKFMKLDANGPELLFLVKEGSVGLSSGGADFSVIESKLDMFIGSIMERLDAQDKKIETVLDTVVQAVGMGSLGSTRDQGGSGVSHEMRTWMDGVDDRLAKLERNIIDCKQEAYRQRDRMTFLVSQGGSLVKSGTEMREGMRTIYDATEALSLKVRNFDVCLTAQASHVSNCLDRLSTLEYRTRPGYVDPNKIRQPKMP